MTKTTRTTGTTGATGRTAPDTDGLAGLGAGLDALDGIEVRRTPVRELLARKVFPLL
ncbi:hypothetical protein [Streptomyces sp. LN785]|uniref:hypothetical protein n=1 Tax=Streptomyces sp. LN785 TaxID=3112983 RepID=UPI00371281BF